MCKYQDVCSPLPQPMSYADMYFLAVIQTVPKQLLEELTSLKASALGNITPAMLDMLRELFC